MALDLTGLKRPERSIANCTVTDVSSGAFPRDVTVKIPGVDGEVILAKWYGQTPLAVNDLVRIWVDGESQIARIAGESFSSTQSTASVDSAKVSTVYSPDLTIAALTADNSGDITLATGDVILSAGDVLFADGGGFKERTNNWIVPDDDFAAFSGWTWESTDFDGAPSTVDVSTYTGILRLMNDSIVEDHFAYKTVSGETATFTARMTMGQDSYGGIRCDNENDDDYFEMRIINGTTTGTIALQKRYRIAAGSVVTGTLLDNIPMQFVTLRLRRVGATQVRWDFFINAPFYRFLDSVSYSTNTWTTIRYGIIFGQRSAANSPDRAAFFDWIAQDG